MAAMAAMAAMATIPERVIASVVIVSAGLSMWALRQSNESNRLAEQSAVTARDSLALAERNETRLEKQDLQQIAIRVYLGGLRGKGTNGIRHRNAARFGG
jgi:hypothetical protein